MNCSLTGINCDAIIRNTTSEPNFNRLLNEAATSGDFEGFIRKSPEFREACLAVNALREKQETENRVRKLSPLRDTLKARLTEKNFGFNDQVFENYGEFRISFGRDIELSIISDDGKTFQTICIVHEPHKMPPYKMPRFLHRTTRHFGGNMYYRDNKSKTEKVEDEIAEYILMLRNIIMMSVDDVYKVFKHISPKIAKFYRDCHKICGYDIFVRSNENFFEKALFEEDPNLYIDDRKKSRLIQCMEKLRGNAI